MSGSGKSSLALGVLYAEGSRRYLEALSTYTRRRLTQAGRASVDEVLHVPAALALRQRPGVLRLLRERRRVLQQHLHLVVERPHPPDLRHDVLLAPKLHHVQTQERLVCLLGVKKAQLVKLQCQLVLRHRRVGRLFLRLH